MFYSILGYIYEILVEMFLRSKGYVKRGLLFGPYCPIYGIGAIVFILLFYSLIKKSKTKNNKFLLFLVIFLSCSTIATLIELSSSYLSELFIGKWPWSYKKFMWNFEGRIAFMPSLAFGIGGILILYIIHPLLQNKISKISVKWLDILCNLLLFILIIDTALTVLKYIFK